MNEYFVSIEFELFRPVYAESFEAASLDKAIEHVHYLMGEDNPDTCAYLTEHNSSGVCTNTLSIRP